MSKQVTASIIVIFLFFYGRALAVSQLALSSSAVAPGDTVGIPVVLSSSETVAAVQCNIPELPEGLSLLEVRFDKQASIFRDWNLSANRLYNGSTKILGFDESSNGISNECCEFAELVVTADKSAKPKVYPLEMAGLLIVDRDGQILASDRETGYLTVTGTDDVVFDVQADTIGLYDQSTQLQIFMTSLANIAGFQIDLVDSADIFRGVDIQNPFGDGWDVYCEELENGSLRILASGMSGGTLPDSSVFALIVDVGTNPDVRGGAYPVSIENVIVSDENAESLTGAGNSTRIFVDSLLPASFDLLQPGNNYTVASNLRETRHVWQQSSFLPVNNPIVYDLKIKVKNYDSPTVNYYTGSDTSATLNILHLFTILDSLGISMENVQELQWWVNARTDQRSRRSESLFNLDIHNFAAVEEKARIVPNVYRLYPNYPNPFNSTTIIQFTLPKTESVKLTIFNLLGQEVSTLTDEMYSAGDYRLLWNGHNKNDKTVESGIYLVTFQAGDYRQTRKLVFLK